MLMKTKHFHFKSWYSLFIAMLGIVLIGCSNQDDLLSLKQRQE